MTIVYTTHIFIQQKEEKSKMKHSQSNKESVVPQVADVFAHKNADADLAGALAYTVIRPDDALYVHIRGGWKVASRDKSDALAYQGWTLCLDNLAQFLRNPETSDDGKSEATRVKEWMLSQK